MPLCYPLIPWSVVHLGFHHICWGLNHLSCLVAAGAVKREKGRNKCSSNAPSFFDDEWERRLDKKHQALTGIRRSWTFYFQFEPRGTVLAWHGLLKTIHSIVPKATMSHSATLTNSGQSLADHPKPAWSLHLHDGVLLFRTPPVPGRFTKNPCSRVTTNVISAPVIFLCSISSRCSIHLWWL